MEKNFKVLIGALAGVVVLLVGILIYVVVDRNSIINDLTVDKETLTAEMMQLQQDYSALSSTNDTLNNELMLEKEKVAQLIERVRKTEAKNKAQLRKYEKELGTLRSIMRGYIKQIDSLNTLNTNLRKEAAVAKKEARESRKKYDNLKSTTEELGKQVELGSVVKGRGLTMVGVNETGKETDRSSRTAKLKTCLNLVENTLAKKGPRIVYIRVKGPDGILMTSGQQQIFTVGGEQMIYSASRQVDYQGSEVEVCIYFSAGEKFTKGVYTVDAYTTEGKLASGDCLLR
jgi:outer membrane murein-binding lipoprotein Lpp